MKTKVPPVSKCGRSNCKVIWMHLTVRIFDENSVAQARIQHFDVTIILMVGMDVARSRFFIFLASW